jgi:arylsulfatase A-like enzyme
VVAIAAACAPEPRRSALLLTLDTTRADALSCYGNPEATTPALDALAADGVRFDSAHTVMALTLPAHASMLTGLTPVRHGLRDNGVAVLPESAATVAERARAAGLDTAAFVSSVVLDDDFGLDQGFDVYSVPSRRDAAERAHGAERSAAATIDAALAWLAERDGERPFFLWVHLYDPHDPYQPPAPFDTRFSTPYLGEVAAMDSEIGRMMEALDARGLADELFVLALADHGEAFGEHGELTHGAYVYETTLRVPFLARWPRSAPTRRSGEVSEERVGAVDVAPTLAEALGLEALDAGGGPDGGLDGLSFYARPLPPERGLYFESYYGFLAYGWSPLAGWLDGGGKYVHSSEPELYDLAADPRESVDLSASARAGELERFRAAIAAQAARPALDALPLGAAGDDTLAEIRALGYAGAGEGGAELPHPLAPLDLPSPRSQSGFFAQQVRAVELAAAGRRADAVALWKEVLVEQPGNYLALGELGNLYLALGRPAEAVGVLETLVASAPPRGVNHHKLGLALLAAGKPAEAVAPLTRAVELTAGRPRYLAVLRETLAQLGRAREIEALEARFGRGARRE